MTEKELSKHLFHMHWYLGNIKRREEISKFPIPEVVAVDMLDYFANEERVGAMEGGSWKT